MKTKEILVITLTMLLSIALSSLLYQYLKDLFIGSFTIHNEINSQIKNQLESSVHYGLFIQCFALLFALISLPIIFSLFREKMKIRRKSLGKIILVLEVFGFLLAYLTTPPDYISTVLTFVAWQLPIIINVIALSIITKEEVHNIN